MRKVRDYNAELKALGDKASALKTSKIKQLGELVVATGADAVDLETLAGMLLSCVADQNAEAKEAWAKKGAAFFQRRRKAGRSSAGENGGEPETNVGRDTQDRG